MSNYKCQITNQIQMSNVKFDIKLFDIDLTFGISYLTFKILVISFVIISYLLVPLTLLSAEITINNYIHPFYNRYSRHLDSVYDVKRQIWYDNQAYFNLTPNYIWNPLKRSREIMSLASAYKYRVQNSALARLKIEQAILNATLRSKRLISDQSFDQAIADFLILRMLEQIDNPPLFTQKTINKILNYMAERLPYGLKAADTENRAALAGVYWHYVGKYLYDNKILTDDEWLDVQKSIKNKIDLSIEQTLNDDYIYRESGHFSLHYHIVEAYMLLAYGKITNQPQYLEIAQKMTDYANQLAKSDGFLDAHLGHRPTGEGAQAYLMMAVLNQGLASLKEAKPFLDYAQGNSFFRDPKYPDRLVWWDTALTNPTKFYDDYSFLSMAELALVIIN